MLISCTVDNLLPRQGELINVIERNVENAGVYANQGRKEIRKAVVYHESNRKVSTHCFMFIL